MMSIIFCSVMSFVVYPMSEYVQISEMIWLIPYWWGYWKTVLHMEFVQ